MRVLIAGGRGFLGSALRRQLESAGHQVQVLTRRKATDPSEVTWDGCSVGDWAACLTKTDAVINVTGYGLEHWPWSAKQKRRFHDSRVVPARALVSAIEAAPKRPAVFVQISGINHYGLRGSQAADESTPAADDYLAQLTVQMEAATETVEQMGLRRVVARSAVVLAPSGGLLWLMALPVRLMIGGRLGSGRQTVPWIHIEDELRAFQFLLEREDASGPFNLIAPQTTSNAEFMQAVAHALHRPYWFPTPGSLLRLTLGEMSNLVLAGRAANPKRLIALGFRFKYPQLDLALANIFGRS